MTENKRDEQPPQRQKAKDEAGSAELLSTLNASTRRRQNLLLGGVAAVLLAGAAWFLLGTDSSNKAGTDKTSVDTSGLVNRDLSEREFVTMFGNRLDAVARAQKELKDAAVPRSEVDEQMAALKAENEAMRTNVSVVRTFGTDRGVD
ncbi:MAG: hypothetical protein WCL10_14580 [Novosphingobium sp.]|uniref:hypothetical protein n=1 Tax=Novosphingobium sp. TaxID=1874826 RepID=UPI00301A796E